MLDLEALATFVEVVANRSFSAGARARGLPRPTVTRQIAALELALGVRLIERTTRSMRVTDAGVDLHARARRILDEVTAAQSAVAERQGRLSGHIRFSAPVEYGMTYLGPIVAGFVRKHPDVRITIHLTSERVDLVDEPVDVALRIGRLADSTHLASRIGSVAFWLCAAPTLLAHQRAPRKPEELRDVPLLLFDSGNRRRSWTLSTRARSVVVQLPAGVIEANNHGLLLAAAIAGVGFVRLPSFFAARAVEAGTLKRILPQWTFPELPIHALYRAGPQPLRTRAFLEHLKEAVVPAE